MSQLREMHEDRRAVSRGKHLTPIGGMQPTLVGASTTNRVWRGKGVWRSLAMCAFLSLFGCSSTPDACSQPHAALFDPCGDIVLCGGGGPYGQHLTIASVVDGGTQTACVTTASCNSAVQCTTSSRQGSCVQATPTTLGEFQLDGIASAVNVCVLGCVADTDCPAGGKCVAAPGTATPSKVCAYVP